MAQTSETRLPLAALERLPVHVAFIMDGNGRWAQQRGLPRSAGHQAGKEAVRRTLEACIEFGIRYVTLYAFSTENWRRPLDEVRSLMALFESISDNEVAEIQRQGVRILHVGRSEGLPPLLRKRIHDIVQATRDNSRLIVCVALNYGGRAEIVDAIKRMMEGGVTASQVSEELVNQYLYTAGIPDPDLVIRTAGEMRLSNFLIWQAAYAEYYSTPTYWPDFNKEELYRALLSYSQRKRRFGQLDSQVTG